MKASNLQHKTLPPLLKTNLRIPPLHGELIERTVLMDRLALALSYPLTLIIAPAGFGKTTLLSQWVSTSEAENVRERVAWVSLENECDLHRFWTYVTTTLEEMQPGIGKSILTWFDTPQPNFHAVVRTLVNEISEAAKEFVLVLDDYHHIEDSTIHATLTFFIEHLPSNLHLIIASRSQPPLPLARWRASNQLYELREDDLRFTPEEVTAFFNEAKRLNLLPQEITALGRRTEGWVAGLQLVALSIQGFDQRSKHRFVSAFTGSQRYILDYLVEEVLERQPDHIKSFLLETSVLTHLNASLCNVVTGHEDSQSILEYLERAHLFTIPLDYEQRWYRYHHLFKDVLYHQLTQDKPDAILELHRRAMEWFIRAERTEDAIRHATAAHEWDQAIKLLEPVIDIAWNRAEMRKIIEWLEKLPPEQLDAHPHLSLYYSRALLHGGQLEAADQRLREAESTLHARVVKSSNPEDQLLGTIYAFRTTVAAVSSQPENALHLGHEALNLLPLESMDMRAYVLNSLGVAHYHLGNMSEAVRLLADGGGLAEKAGVLYPQIAAASFRAEALMCQGHLKQAWQVLRQTLDTVAIPKQPNQPWSPATSLICAIYGQLLYEWNRLEECECYSNEAIELGQQHAFSRPVWVAYHTLIRIKLASGDQAGALQLFRQAQHHQRLHSLPVPERLIRAKQARIWLTLGQSEDTERWALTCNDAATLQPAFIQEFERITLARMYLSQNHFHKALTLLEQLRADAESSDRYGHLLEILALTALGQEALGQTDAALGTLHKALQMAEPEGYLRTFVDAGKPMATLLYRALTRGLFPEYVARLLALFPANDKTSSPPKEIRSLNTKATEEAVIEPLSQREVEVLQLMASGTSNEEIAAKLIIAPTTAKKHVSNILRKLDVENRTQAVVRGRDLGLC